MKKLMMVSLLLAWFGTKAQKEFGLEWKTEFPLNTEFRMINDERTLALGGDLSAMAMMDAVTGKLLWQVNFKEKLGQRKALDWSWDHDAHTVWVDVKGEKKNEVITHFFDEKNGEPLSKSTYETRKQSREKNRYAFKGVLQTGNTHIWLEYEKKKVVASMGKGAKAELVVHASGDHNWTSSVQGRYVRTLCANAIPEAAKAFGGDFLKLMCTKDKVFVIYEGMSVLDLKTGKLLWQVELDNSDYDFGMFKQVQTLGRAGYPYADESGVYVADLSKGQYRIKKYNMENGTMLWQSEPFAKDDVVPDLQVAGKVLVAQFGGRIETQTYIPGVSGRPDVCRSEYRFAGNAGVKVYDTETGKLLWQTTPDKVPGDKFNGSITNILTDEKTVYVASDKKVYAFDLAGNTRFSVPVKDLKIGKPVMLIVHGNNLLLHGEAGIASVSMTDGTVNFATNTGKALGVFFAGEAFYVWTGKEPAELKEFIRLDPVSGKLMGKMKDTSRPYFTPEGNAFIKFNGAKLMRYRTI